MADIKISYIPQGNELFLAILVVGQVFWLVWNLNNKDVCYE